MYVNPLQFYTYEITYKLMGENREKNEVCCCFYINSFRFFVCFTHAIILPEEK